MPSAVGKIPVWRPFYDLPDDFFLIMYGQRRSGKNTLMMHMLEEMERRLKFHKVTVVSKTAEVNKEQYDQFPPNTLFSNAANLDEILGNILREQEERMTELREEMEAENDDDHFNSRSNQSKRLNGAKVGKLKQSQLKGRSKAIQRQAERSRVGGRPAPVGGNEPKSRKRKKKSGREAEKEMKSKLDKHLVILDDVVSENTIRHSPALNAIAVTGRHQNISLIVMSHMVRGSGSVPPIIRTQADTIVVVAITRSANEMKTLVNEYLCPEGKCDRQSKAAAEKILIDTTRTQYKALVIDNSASANADGASDFLSTYGPVGMPPTRPDFRVGTDEQWESDDEEDKPTKYRDDMVPKAPPAKRLKNEGKYSRLELLKPNKPKTLPSVFGDV